MTGPSTPAPEADAGAFLGAADIYANARGLGAFLLEKSSEIEAVRRLPSEVAERIRSAGMFRLTMPKSWGGPELSTIEQVEVIEELSKANASVGWCVMIGCDSGLFSGYLDDAAGRELYPSLDLATAGHALPVGRADRVEGGYRINGQWPFGSGITHADVVSAGCVIYANGVPEMISERVPRWRLMLAPSSSFEIADTWYTTGLRGTGSNDYRAHDLFIPERHSLSFSEPAKRNAPPVAQQQHDSPQDGWGAPGRRSCGNRFLPRRDAGQSGGPEHEALQEPRAYPEHRRRRRNDVGCGAFLRLFIT
jgi:alkylation response protein AidB-like acyl-CoA dehydrogenase